MKSAIDNKGNMGGVVSVFITVLIVAVIVGITFLFTTNIKTTASNVDTQRTSYNVVNETLRVNASGVSYSVASYPYVKCETPSYVANATDGSAIGSRNYTLNNCNIAFVDYGSKAYNNTLWTINYTYSIPTGMAYLAINSTEKAGSDIVTYMPILLLALIFGVILMVVLKFVLPIVGKSGEI